jgi:hypothetical protein
MRRYLVQVQFEAPAVDRFPVRFDTLKAIWGQGHKYDLVGPGCLVLAAVVSAPGEAEALRQTIARVEQLSSGTGKGMLRLTCWTARRVRVPLLAGVRSGRGDFRDNRDGDGEEGGLAGVREPRRPVHPPGHLFAARRSSGPQR